MAFFVPLEGKDGTGAELQIHVSAEGDGGTKSQYSTGRHVLINGNLMVRASERGNYYNLRAENIEFCKSTENYRISGSMNFKGKIHDDVKEHPGKSGKTFQTFSGFSSDKDGDKVYFSWVRFLSPTVIDAECFGKGKYVEVSGDFTINIFKCNINLECRINDIKEWKLPVK